MVVTQGEAGGGAPLLNVKHKETVIRKLPTEVIVFEGADCTRGAVLAGLENTTWVHFACHSYQEPNKPFKSHFSLRSRNEPLTVLDVIKTEPPQAELAVLLSCHSAAGDKDTPNEAIHLAAGVMFAGFRGVVGTMWSMDDEYGPIIAEEFYNYMFRDGPEAVDCRDAAKALEKAVRVLRRRKAPLERWINFVHYGI